MRLRLRHRLALTAIVAVPAVALIAGSNGAAALPPFCQARDLTTVFAYLPGSAGAGHVGYELRLRNRSHHVCAVSGLPGLRLLGRHFGRLPTHVVPQNPGALTAVLVNLLPGHAAFATARFSPDVPGPGEGNRRQCEPTAFYVRVRPPQSAHTLVGRVRPPTPVCEHGSMTLTALGGHG